MVKFIVIADTRRMRTGRRKYIHQLGYKLHVPGPIELYPPEA